VRERRSGISRKVRIWRRSSDGRLEREDDSGVVSLVGEDIVQCIFYVFIVFRIEMYQRIG